MPIIPYTIAASAEKVYDQIRVGNVQLYQPAVGEPLMVQYTINRYRVVSGVAEDAPNGGGSVVSTMQMGVPALAADVELAAAVELISTRIAADAIAKGLLGVQ